MRTIYQTKISPITTCPDIDPANLDLIIKELALKYDISRDNNIELLRILSKILRGECHLVALGDLNHGKIKHVTLCYKNYLYDYRGRVSDELILSFGSLDTCEIKDVHPEIIETQMFNKIYSPPEIEKEDLDGLRPEEFIRMALNLDEGVPIR